MTKVAVVAHDRKVLDGADLDDLRAAVTARGIVEPLWYQASASKKAPEQARRALAAGAEPLLVWGGDGTVRRCIDAIADDGVPIGILPAGTANQLARSLGIPIELDGALDVALHGGERRLRPQWPSRTTARCRARCSRRLPGLARCPSNAGIPLHRRAT